MTSLQLYHAVKQDVLIPWNKNQPEEWKDGNELVVADRGGFIYEPEYGIHDHIGELDFTSLYPKIMWQKNLSGETVKCSCCPNSTNRVPELDYNICQRWTGIVPLSLDILLKKRAIYKTRKKEAKDEAARSLYDQRQSALKWILVCSFWLPRLQERPFWKNRRAHSHLRLLQEDPQTSSSHSRSSRIPTSSWDSGFYVAQEARCYS